MEVHKHLHDVTYKKKWAEYLLEFSPLLAFNKAMCVRLIFFVLF